MAPGSFSGSTAVLKRILFRQLIDGTDPEHRLILFGVDHGKDLIEADEQQKDQYQYKKAPPKDHHITLGIISRIHILSGCIANEDIDPVYILPLRLSLIFIYLFLHKELYPVRYILKISHSRPEDRHAYACNEVTESDKRIVLCFITHNKDYNLFSLYGKINAFLEPFICFIEFSVESRPAEEHRFTELCIGQVLEILKIEYLGIR